MASLSSPYDTCLELQNDLACIWNYVVEMTGAKNRSKHEILVAVLDVIGNGNNFTKIMYGAYLSYSHLKDCLYILQQNKLVEKKGKVYKITEKGRWYIQKYKELDKMIIFSTAK